MGNIRRANSRIFDKCKLCPFRTGHTCTKVNKNICVYKRRSKKLFCPQDGKTYEYVTNYCTHAQELIALSNSNN